MAELTLQVVRSPEDGALVVRVALRSAEDATPAEHERDHRRLVARLFPGLDLSDGSCGNVAVERERPEQEPSPPCSCGDGGYEVIDLG